MKIIFSDFDGTLTDNGLLGSSFFELLDELKMKNVPLIIVSGRSASWGQFLLTHFELDCAIMEGGGVILRKVNGLIKHQLMVENEDLENLHKIYQEVLQTKGVISAADNLGRLTDRAIEAEKMKNDDVDKVVNFLDGRKVHHSRSNVHLNFWCGNVSKARAIETILEERHISESACCYFGDSLNDQSVFEYMTHTIGVSNISKVLSQMTHKPKLVLKGKDNEEIHGVSRFVKDLLKAN